MLTFKTFFLYEKAVGAEAGDLEFTKISTEDAIKYSKSKLGSKFDEIKNFSSNFELIKSRAKLGWTKRKDMPRITTSDIQDFKDSLSKGKLDIKAPFSSNTDSKNLFPEKLKGGKAKSFLNNGLNDNDANDDKVKVSFKKIAVGTLKPTQKQIYFDTTIGYLTRGSIKSSVNFLQNSTTFVASSDGYIIDGHHRFAMGCILNPSIKVNVLVVELPAKQLMKLALAYGDAIGNERNA